MADSKITFDNTAENLGWSQKGTDKLQELASRPQQALFAPINALQKGKSAKDAIKSSAKAILGKEPKISAEELAGNVQDKYDVKNKYALAGLSAAAAATDMFVDPMSLVNPVGKLAKKAPMLGGTVQDLAKQSEVRQLASQILSTGNVDALKAVGVANEMQLSSSLANLTGAYRHGAPTARNIVADTRIPTNLPDGTVGVLKSSPPLQPVASPGLISGVSVPANASNTKMITSSNPTDTLVDKLSTAKAAGTAVELPMGLSTEQAKQARKILEAQGIKVKGVGPK